MSNRARRAHTYQLRQRLLPHPEDTIMVRLILEGEPRPINADVPPFEERADALRDRILTLGARADAAAGGGPQTVIVGTPPGPGWRDLHLPPPVPTLMEELEGYTGEIVETGPAIVSYRIPPKPGVTFSRVLSEEDVVPALRERFDRPMFPPSPPLPDFDPEPWWRYQLRERTRPIREFQPVELGDWILWHWRRIRWGDVALVLMVLWIVAVLVWAFSAE